jgi:hypothetical protein
VEAALQTATAAAVAAAASAAAVDAAVEEADAVVAAAAAPAAAAAAAPAAAAAAAAEDDNGFEMVVMDVEQFPLIGDYTADVYRILDQQVLAYLPQPDYMRRHPALNGKMREILVHWLSEVHVLYKLGLETSFLSINLVDRFLARSQNVPRNKLQLVGVSCTLIAAKFEEVHPPRVENFSHICAAVFSNEEILTMEVSILTSLKFDIAVPTAAHFWDRYQRANECTELHRHLFQYILELSLTEVALLRFAPSHAAAAACLLSNQLMRRQPYWSETMARHTGSTEKALEECASALSRLLKPAEDRRLQAVHNKFSLGKFGRVAKRAGA